MAGAAAPARPDRSVVSRLTPHPHRAESLVFNRSIPTGACVMPTFNIQLFEGRTVEQKRAFVEAITRVTCETLGCAPGSVDIILTDVKKENWATAGKLWSDEG
nr:MULTISPECIES: 4-oxalocrotonate tautomerase [Burkholderia]